MPAAVSSVCRARHRTRPSSLRANGRRASGSNPAHARCRRRPSAPAGRVPRTGRGSLPALRARAAGAAVSRGRRTSWSTLAGSGSLSAALSRPAPPRWAGGGRRRRVAPGTGSRRGVSGGPIRPDGARPLLRASPARLLGLRPPVAPARAPGPARAGRRARPVRIRGHPEAAIRAWGLDPARTRTVLSGPGRTRGRVARRTRGLPERLLPRRRRARAAQAARRDRGRTPACARPAGFARSSCSRATGHSAASSRAGSDPPRPRLRRGARLALSGALAVACVSREEGFGFTPLEAVARGTPAIVADLPVFDETFGDAAVRVPVGRPGRSGRRAASPRAGAGAARAARGGMPGRRSSVCPGRGPPARPGRPSRRRPA